MKVFSNTLTVFLKKRSDGSGAIWGEAELRDSGSVKRGIHPGFIAEWPRVGSPRKDTGATEARESGLTKNERRNYS